MKFLNFYNDKKDVCLGIMTDRGVVAINELYEEKSEYCPNDINNLVTFDKDKLKYIELLLEEKKENVKYIDEKDINYAPCVMEPQKIICVGLNYISHSDECNMAVPEFPVLFSKFNNALLGHNGIIELPKTAEKFDYEAELVIVIGKKANNISKGEALSYVFGYTAGNDFSARDLQMRTGQWLLGKTCDGFAPVGPYLVTSDEVNPDNLDIKCIVNGEIRQSANTSDMIFDCATIISYISKYMTLLPGDIIYTGTPCGVILGYKNGKKIWLKSGDKIDVYIEKIGTLSNVLR